MNFNFLINKFVCCNQHTSGESLDYIRGEDVRPVEDRTKVHPILAGSMKRRDLISYTSN